MSYLFSLPQNHVPFALKRYIAKEQELFNEARSGDRPQAKVSYREFNEGGVEKIAGYLLARVTMGSNRAKKYNDTLTASQYEKTWAFALQAYCQMHNRPIPKRLMELTFFAMDCKTLNPSPTFLGEIGLTVDGVKQDNVKIMIDAATLDGYADATGEERSINSLAAEVGTSRKTLRKWRKREDYQATRKIERELHEERAAIFRELNSQ